MVVYKTIFARIFIILLILTNAGLRAQSILFPYNFQYDISRQKQLFTDTTQTHHGSFQPTWSEPLPADTFAKLKHGADLFFDKLFYEDLIKIKFTDKSSGYDRPFRLSINPILNLNYQKDVLDTSGNKIYTNTRGLWVKGEIGKKFHFESSFFENQSFFPQYIKSTVNASGVVSGQGRWKEFRKTGYDYAMACGVMSLDINNTINVRAGHGKIKIGNGYRSLLLSDNAFNFPYAQINLSFLNNKIKYSQTYALLMNLTAGGTKTPPYTERIFQKKPASFQYLSIAPNKFIEVGFFNGMIWNKSDSNNRTCLGWQYANPVIFSNLGFYGFDSSVNLLSGINFQFKLFRKIGVFGQLMYDGKNPAEERMGYQSGIKWFDAFTIKNLYIHSEFNSVTSTAYRNPYAGQGYNHYNESLAYPIGGPVMEVVGIISYRYKRLNVMGKYNTWKRSGSGQNSTMRMFDFNLSYMLNQSYALNICAGITVREQSDKLPTMTKNYSNQIFYVALRTSIYNLYFDY